MNILSNMVIISKILIVLLIILLILLCVNIYYTIKLIYSISKKESYIRDEDGNVDVYEDEDDENDEIKKKNSDVFRKTDYIKLNKKTYKSKKFSD
jgi:hypothetical protein